jgi:hypothetical protein
MKTKDIIEELLILIEEARNIPESKEIVLNWLTEQVEKLELEI